MVIYAKTPLGVEALQTRALPLPRRAWQLLIMIDGKQDTGTLAKAFADALSGLIDALLAEKLIEPHGEAAPVPAQPEPAAAPSAPADAPASGSAETIQNIRNLMVNTTLSFAGHVGGDLIKRVKEATTLDDFRTLRPEWHKMIAQNPMAMMQLQSLEKYLDKLFH